jgi:hypothetical protein
VNILDTKRLLLRHLRADDADFILELRGILETAASGIAQMPAARSCVRVGRCGNELRANLTGAEAHRGDDGTGELRLHSRVGKTGPAIRKDVSR